MSNQNSKSEKQNTNSLIGNGQGSGSEYHRERAGKVEGYGQPDSVNGVENKNR
ncbi:hypothetical protein [Cytobacillus sp. NCCP-133]|uniref:hypothetical protein n=1 Tax=Cytobacillus sp. NCCP-133 TaxID=766848 RepID=UPI0022302117|nr:hypothetical protein [Cytobacillus sp. NCCP-133]GLB61631.1 hypothetical protein NCCP133_37600 [Cytobacillus sp. NCCP-133]